MSVLRIVVGTIVLALTTSGCASRTTGTAQYVGVNFPAAVTTAPPDSAATDSELGREMPGMDLSAGLLPAEAFGPGAFAEPVDDEELQGNGSSDFPPGSTVTPARCAEDGSDDRADRIQNQAAQGVIVPGGSFFLQMLSASAGTFDADRPGPGCEQISVDLADGSRMTMQFSTLDIAHPDSLAGPAGAFRMDSEVTGPDGSTYQSSTVSGHVIDGDRASLLMMMTQGPHASVDDDAFVDLLRQAYDHQHAVLG